MIGVCVFKAGMRIRTTLSCISKEICFVPRSSDQADALSEKVHARKVDAMFWRKSEINQSKMKDHRLEL
jgi:hypothetical protein